MIKAPKYVIVRVAASNAKAEGIIITFLSSIVVYDRSDPESLLEPEKKPENPGEPGPEQITKGPISFKNVFNLLI